MTNGQSAGGARPGRERSRVLVAEDHGDAAESLALLLSMSGSEVVVVEDGIEAVARALSFRPDVVLLDIDLPGQSGYEAARQIAAGLDYEPVFVALTGSGLDEDRRRSKMAGFHHHVVKPVDLAELERLLATLPASPGRIGTSRS